MQMGPGLSEGDLLLEEHPSWMGRQDGSVEEEGLGGFLRRQRWRPGLRLKQSPLRYSVTYPQ